MPPVSTPAGIGVELVDVPQPPSSMTAAIHVPIAAHRRRPSKRLAHLQADFGREVSISERSTFDSSTRNS